jgi:hypothetical protein
VQSDERSLSIRRHKTRLVVSLGAVIGGIMVPLVTFRFATELAIVVMATSDAVWQSASASRLGLVVTGIATALGILAGAAGGVRFWRHFLESVVPRLLRPRPIDASGGAAGGDRALPQWLRASPAWWAIFVVPGYVVCAAFGASLVGIALLVPALIAVGHTGVIGVAWHMALKPGPSGYSRGLVALILSVLTGPFVAGIYSAVAWVRAVEGEEISGP